MGEYLSVHIPGASRCVRARPFEGVSRAASLPLKKQRFLVQCAGSTSYIATVADANVAYVTASAGAQRAWSVSIAGHESTHATTIANQERIYLQALAPVEATYQIALLNANRDYTVAGAEAVHGLTMTGDQQAYQNDLDLAGEIQSSAEAAANLAFANG